jgi:hypothetical protein
MKFLDANPRDLVAALGLLLAAIVLSLLAVKLWRLWQRRRLSRARSASIEKVALAQVRDMLVPDGNGGHLHLDWLLLTTRGLLVLDVRDVHGNVFGSEQMGDWTVMNGAARSTFPNPLPALLDRLAVLSRLVPQIGVEGRVLFTENARFPKGTPQNCLVIHSLAAEFPVVEAGAAAGMSATMMPHWERLLSQLTASNLPQRQL